MSALNSTNLASVTDAGRVAGSAAAACTAPTAIRAASSAGHP